MTDASLRQVVSQARSALSDDEQNIIVTVRGFGYRFAGPIVSMTESGTFAPPSPVGPRTAVAQSRFVGRERELERLKAALHAARDGKPQLFSSREKPGLARLVSPKKSHPSRVTRDFMSPSHAVRKSPAHRSTGPGYRSFANSRRFRRRPRAGCGSARMGGGAPGLLPKLEHKRHRRADRIADARSSAISLF